MIKNSKIRLIFLLLLINGGLSAQAAEPATASVQLDRAWGLMLGDEIKVLVDLPIKSLAALDEESLPAIDQRHGYWLLLREITFPPNKQDNVQMILRYQVVATSDQAEQVLTPEFSIRTKQNQWIKVPPAAIMLSTVLPIKLSDDDPAAMPRADHAAPLFDTVAQGKKTIFWAGLAGVCLLLAMVWHFGWRKQHRQPFERALIVLGKLKGDEETVLSESARILHRAFNATAAETIVQSTLPDFLEKQSRFQHLATEIAQFYQATSGLFFGLDPQAPIALDLAQIKSLANACRRVERLR